MPFYWLIIGTLGVWRTTHLLNAEDGPWNVFLRLRTAVRGSMAGKAIECFYCLTMLTSIPFALIAGSTWKERIMLWFAMSGGAILLERATTKEPARSSAFFEEAFPMEEDSDAQLRR